MLKQLLLTLPLVFLASGQQLTREISDRFLQNAPELAHVHLIPFIGGEGETCVNVFNPYNDIYNPEYYNYGGQDGPFGPFRPQRLLQYQYNPEIELDICRVEFFLEFEANINFTDLGIGDTDFFVCTELFDFFQENITETVNGLVVGDLVNINDLLQDQLCEFCLEGDVGSTPFAILVVPEISPRDIFFPYYYYYGERRLQDDFRFFDQKLIRLKNQADTLEVFQNLDFRAVDGSLINQTHVAVQYNSDIHFVQLGERTTESFDIECELMLQNFRFGRNVDLCTFSIIDSFLVIKLGRTVNDLFLRNGFLNFIEEPPIYAVTDRFGLKRQEDSEVFMGGFVALDRITQISVDAFEMQFNEPMNQQNIARVRCSDIIDFALDPGQGPVIPYFVERPDYFCAVQWTSQFTADLIFLENVPIIFSDLTPVFNQNGPITRANGFGVPVDVFGSVGPNLANFPLNVTVEANTLTFLSVCDTEIFIELQISGLTPVLTVVNIDSITVDASTDIGATLPPLFVPSDFCQILGASLRCDITKLNITAEAANVDYRFLLSVEAVGLPSDSSTNVFIDALPTIFITQNREDIRIPIDIPGVSFRLVEQIVPDIPVRLLQDGEVATIQRGVASTFSAIVGDIFGCVGVDTSLLVLAWQVFDVSERVPVLVLSRFGRILNIPGDALAPNVPHIVTFTATLVSNDITTAVEFDLAVRPAEVVLVPEFGSEQTVSDQAGNLTLSAQRSCNPNLIQGIECRTGIGFINNQVLEETDVDELAQVTGLDAFDLEWSCLNCGNRSDAVFEGIDRTQPVVVIPLTNFEGLDTSNLQFSFTATDPQQVQDVSSIEVAVKVLVTPEECIFPTVTIAPVDARVNANAAVALQGAIDPKVAATFLWEETTNALEPIFDVNDAALTRLALFIPANSLSEGSTYTFRLNVRPDCAGENDIVPSAVASFQVNRRPTGGVLNVAPLVGDSFTDFVLTTSGWQDFDGDLPLQFSFELIYLGINEELPAEFKAKDTIPLSQFSTRATITTKLQVPPPGTKPVIIAVARDALGAVSRRVAGNAFDQVTVNNPFVNDGVVDVDAIDVTVIQGLIEDLLAIGDPSQIPNLCSAVTSALNGLSDEEIAVIENLVGLQALEDIRSECFNAVLAVVAIEDDNLEVDTDVVNLVASSISTITEEFDQLDEEILENVENVTNQLVQNMQAQVDAIRRGDFDPAAGSIIPESFKQNILDTVSNILSASDNLFGPGSSGNTVASVSRRRLQALDPCAVLGGARNNVVDLTNLETSVVTNGAPAVDAEANTVSFTATRENINDVGVLSQLLVVPDSQGGDNEIELPAVLAEQLRNLEGQDVDLNILAAKWKVLIRCEQRPIEEVTCNRDYAYDGPREGAEGNIVSLDFFPFDGTGNNITVEEIAEPIVIFLDLPVNIDANADLSAILDECQAELDLENGDNEIRELEVDPVFDDIVCGFFDEVNGDFITEFCNFVGLEERNGVNKVRCECFHATDYAAWNAFRYDVKATLKPQLILSDLAKIILLGICPVILLLLGILLLWAYYRDRKDAKNILKGALARIKLMRIIKMRQKRQFFDRIKVAQVETIMNIHDAKYNEKSSRRTVASKSKYFCRQFYLAVKYEHSLFGLSRYDPNFSRVQRVWIFIAVFISSFGSAALLFELRSNVYEISVFVTVAVSFGAAFMVSIPVKVVARALFKTTENKANSKEDQVNSLYKIITRLELADGVETETDKALVDALHDFHIAESTLKKKGFKGSTLRRTNTLVALTDNDNVAQVVEGSGEDDDLQVAVVVESFIKAKDSLNEASQSARNAWKKAKAENLQSGKYYSSWSKIRSVRKTSSGVLKTATLFTGEASKVARPRESRLPYCIVVFDYFMLTLVVLFYMYYIFQFVATRSDRAENGFEGNLDPEFEAITEQEYIIEWVKGALGGILVSYLIAEPLIALLRYILVPWLIHKCSKEPELPDEIEIDVEKKVELNQFDEKKQKDNIRDSNLHLGIDLIADLIENLF